MVALLMLLVLFKLIDFNGIVAEEGRGMFKSSHRYLVVRLHRLGLANRLRSMADFHVIASSSNRHLLISWSPTADCNASFVDLFASGMDGDMASTSFVSIFFSIDFITFRSNVNHDRI